VSRLAIGAALEALAAGDTREAAAVLLAALEQDAAVRLRPHICSCGAAFEWPGQLEAHRDLHGHERRAA
jgi:hypothetical protein